MAFLEPLIALGEVAAEAAEAGVAATAGASEGLEGAGKALEQSTGTVRMAKNASQGGKKLMHGDHASVTAKTNYEGMMRVLQEFEKQRVLVGIPASKSPRPSEMKGRRLNNATIGLIMERGSPGANIPARPWLVPGVESGRARIVKHYEDAVRAAFKTGNVGALRAAHEKVGAEAVASVRRYVRDASHFVPLKPGTVAARSRQRGTIRRRPSEIKYLSLISAGMAPALAQNVAGIRPLINTAQLLNSVTYVVRPARGRPSVGMFEVI